MEELKENQQRLIEFMEIGDYITLKKELNEENPANIAELTKSLARDADLATFWRKAVIFVSTAYKRCRSRSIFLYGLRYARTYCAVHYR